MEPAYARLSRFFERSSTKKAYESLKAGTEIEIIAQGEAFTFERTKTSHLIKEGKARSAHLTFEFSDNAFDKIVSFPSDDIGELGVEMLKRVAVRDKNEGISIDLHVSPLKLATSGYLGVLLKGGPAVAKFLAERGIIGPRGIQKAFKKLKGVHHD